MINCTWLCGGPFWIITACRSRARHAPDFFDGSREPRKGSDQAKVLGVIRLQLGLRGTDIVKVLGGSVHERTVRTSLHGLNARGAIQKSGDTWIPTPAPHRPEKNEGQSPLDDLALIEAWQSG